MARSGSGLVRKVAEAREGNRHYALVWACFRARDDGILDAITEELISASVWTATRRPAHAAPSHLFEGRQPDVAEVRHRVFSRNAPKLDLSSDAVRTHAEGIAYLYQVESRSLEIRRHRLRAVVFSQDWESAVAELVAKRFWKETPAALSVVHHADVIRQSHGRSVEANVRRDKKATAGASRDRHKDGEQT